MNTELFAHPEHCPVGRVKGSQVSYKATLTSLVKKPMLASLMKKPMLTSLMRKVHINYSSASGVVFGLNGID